MQGNVSFLYYVCLPELAANFNLQKVDDTNVMMWYQYSPPGPNMIDVVFGQRPEVILQTKWVKVPIHLITPIIPDTMQKYYDISMWGFSAQVRGTGVSAQYL